MCATKTIFTERVGKKSEKKSEVREFEKCKLLINDGPLHFRRRHPSIGTGFRIGIDSNVFSAELILFGIEKLMLHLKIENVLDYMERNNKIFEILLLAILIVFKNSQESIAVQSILHKIRVILQRGFRENFPQL